LRCAALLSKLEAIQKQFNTSHSGGKRVSLADLIVLAGGVASGAAPKPKFPTPAEARRRRRACRGARASTQLGVGMSR